MLKVRFYTYNNGMAATNLDKKIDTAHNGYIRRYVETVQNDLS